MNSIYNKTIKVNKKDIESDDEDFEEHIPRDILEEAEDEGSEDEGSEEQDQFHVEAVKNFFKNGVENVKTNAAQKREILKYFNYTFNLPPNPDLKKQKEINEYLIDRSKEIIDKTTQDDKIKKREMKWRKYKKSF